MLLSQKELQSDGRRETGDTQAEVSAGPHNRCQEENTESTIQRAGGESRAVTDVLCDLGHVTAPLVSICSPRKWGEQFPPGAGDWNETPGPGQGVCQGSGQNLICAGV